MTKDSREGRIYSANTVGRIVTLELKITLNVISVKRSIPGKIILLDILNLHTKTNFWIICHNTEFFCENICMLNLFDHFLPKYAGMFWCHCSSTHVQVHSVQSLFVTVETEVHTEVIRKNMFFGVGWDQCVCGSLFLVQVSCMRHFWWCS